MLVLPVVAAFSISYLFGLDEPLSSPELAAAPDTRPVPGNTPVEQCKASEKQGFEWVDLTLDPPLPVAGENLTIVASGVLKELVDAGAYVDVQANYGLITLLKQRYDLCENLGEVDLECPVEPGPVSINKEVEMPDVLPPGQYSVSAQAWTADGVLLSCVEAQVVL